MAQLHGIYTPNMVPLDSRGRIDEAGFRSYIDWLIERGIHGLYPNGSTGEFTRFTVEEKRRIIKIACEQCEGRVPVLAGAAEANVREVLAACELYKEYGARAVAVVSPFYYKLSQPAIYAYFREIGRHSPIDVTLYNIPAFASPIEVPTIQRLAELPRIIGIKDSSGDISFMLRMMGAVKPHRPDFVFFTGWDAACVPMLLMGCDGGVHATSGVVPEITRKLYDLTRAGRIEDAKELQLRLIKAFDAMMYGFDFPEGIRAAVEARSIRLGASRQPQGDGKRIDKAALKREIDTLLRSTESRRTRRTQRTRRTE